MPSLVLVITIKFSLFFSLSWTRRFLGIARVQRLSKISWETSPNLREASHDFEYLGDLEELRNNSEFHENPETQENPETDPILFNYFLSQFLRLAYLIPEGVFFLKLDPVDHEELHKFLTTASPDILVPWYLPGQWEFPSKFYGKVPSFYYLIWIFLISQFLYLLHVHNTI